MTVIVHIYPQSLKKASYMTKDFVLYAIKQWFFKYLFSQRAINDLLQILRVF